MDAALQMAGQRPETSARHHSVPGIFIGGTMPIPRITYQLPLALDLPEPEDAGTVEADKVRSEAATTGAM